MLPRQPTGQSQISHWLRQLWDHLRGSEVLDSQDIRWHRSTHGISGTVIKRGGGGAGATAQRFKVTAIANSTLTCRLVDEEETASETDTTIARPTMTLHTKNFPRGKVTGSEATIDAQKRTCSVLFNIATGVSRTVTVTQVIEPAYTVGDFIYAMQATGMPTGTDWIDLNVDARHWEWDYVANQVCVNNAIRWEIFQSSSPSSS